MTENMPWITGVITANCNRNVLLNIRELNMLQFISLDHHIDQHLISVVLLKQRRLASQGEASGFWVCLGEKLHLHHAGSPVVAPVSLTIKAMYSRLI